MTASSIIEPDLSAAPEPNGSAPAPFAPAEGFFVGVGGDFWVQIRTDRTGHKGSISGDLQYIGAGRAATGPHPASGAAIAREADPEGSGLDPDALLSFRSDAPKEPESIEWFDPSGARGHGRMVLAGATATAQDAGADRMTVTLEIDRTATRPARSFEFEVVRAGADFRSLRVRILEERNVRFPDQATTCDLQRNEQRVTVQECLRRAGIRAQVSRHQLNSTHTGPWHESDIFAELADIMRRNTSDTASAPGFSVDLLALSGTDHSSVAGLMFDVRDVLPRQGAAVFVDTIRGINPSDDVDVDVITTAVHELGHALNLVHPFDPEVRRSSAMSFMNYPWRFRTGAAAATPLERAKAFWERFDFRFDDQELRFLRHAPWAQIVPGGAPFGSARYWDTPPRRPDQPDSGLRLWLTAPAAGAGFAFGQRIFLQVSLVNTGHEPVVIPRHALDVKAGDLQLMLSPVTAGVPEARPFVPMMQRCFDLGRAAAQAPIADQAPGKGMISLGPGESIHANLNLSHGSGGPSFAEPGSYDLVPALSLPPGPLDDGLDRIVTGRTLRITVLAPPTRQDEQDGQLLLRPDAGVSLTLGGSSALQQAADDLAEVQARRERDVTGPDPLVPAIARSAGIHLHRQGRLREAARSLSVATAPGSLDYFDPHTAEHTRRLAAELRRARVAAVPPTTVVVDLWTRDPNGGEVRSARVTGFLATPPVSTTGNEGLPNSGRAPAKVDSWDVLASPVNLPVEITRDRQEVSAQITSASGDGLTERVGVSGITVRTPAVDEDGGSPPPAGAGVVQLRLRRPIPARPVPDQDRYLVDPETLASSFFGAPGGELARLAAGHGDEPGAGAVTVDEALQDVVETAPPQWIVPTSTSLGDVGFWPICIFTRRACLPETPGPSTRGGENSSLRSRRCGGQVDDAAAASRPADEARGDTVEPTSTGSGAVAGLGDPHPSA